MERNKKISLVVLSVLIAAAVALPWVPWRVEEPAPSRGGEAKVYTVHRYLWSQPDSSRMRVDWPTLLGSAFMGAVVGGVSVITMNRRRAKPGPAV